MPYRWIGSKLKPHISFINSVLLTELNGEFEKIKNEKAEPLCYLKSQAEKQSASKYAGKLNPNNDDKNGPIDNICSNRIYLHATLMLGSSAVGRKPGNGPKKVATSNTTPEIAGTTKAALSTEREMTPEQTHEKAVKQPTAESDNVRKLIQKLCNAPHLAEKISQALKDNLDGMASITEKSSMTEEEAQLFLPEIVKVLTDQEYSADAKEILTAVAAETELEYVVMH